ncbi:hypothetical protein Pse7367_2815 [Thalassoporum mexicanum PCC 7367]|nr:hypothetical protein Pse7367_2815 [Pseudanabaena sp. PCC 7367]
MIDFAASCASYFKAVEFLHEHLISSLIQEIPYATR